MDTRKEKNVQNKDLLKALTEKTDLKKLIKNWGQLIEAISDFPEHLETLQAFALSHPTNFLAGWFDIERGIEYFHSPSLDEFILKNPDKFLTNWFGIRLAVQHFKQITDTVSDIVFNNPDKFLRGWGNIKDAIATFPEKIETFRNLVFNNPEQFLTSPYYIELARVVFSEHAIEIHKTDIEKNYPVIPYEWKENYPVIPYPSREVMNRFSFVENLSSKTNLNDVRPKDDIEEEWVIVPSGIGLTNS